MKERRRSRSSGGYPEIASSGKTTIAAPASLARTTRSKIFRAFPAMSPTVVLICARAMRSGFMASFSRKRGRGGRASAKDGKKPSPGYSTLLPHALYDRDYYLLNGSNFLYSLYGTMFIFLPAFLYTLHIREGQIGLIMATGTLVSVSLKPVNGLFVDRGGRTAFLVSGALLASASTIPWIFVREGGAHLYAIRIFQGAAYSFFATASYAYIAAPWKMRMA